MLLKTKSPGSYICYLLCPALHILHCAINYSARNANSYGPGSSNCLEGPRDLDSEDLLFIS
jgi:hypothetical protein